MQTNRLILVEDYIEEVSYGGANVVALSPPASYELTRAGIEHDCIDTLVDEAALRANQTVFFGQQVEVFRKWDALLKEKISFCRENNIDLATVNFHRFTNLFDDVIIKTELYRQLFNSFEPSHVEFVYRKAAQEPVFSVFKINQSRKEVSASLIYQLSQQFGCQYSSQTEKVEEKEHKATRSKESFKSLLKRVGGKSLYHYFLLRKYKRLVAKEEALQGRRFLLLHSGAPRIRLVAQTLVENGATVYALNNHSLIRLDSLTEQKVKVDITGAKQSEALALANTELREMCECLRKPCFVTEWLDHEAGVPVAELLYKYFENYFTGHCPELFAAIEQRKAMLQDYKIDVVIGHTATCGVSMPTFIAAKQFQGVRAACFEHSYSLMDNKRRYITELSLFDDYFTSDESRIHFYDHAPAGDSVPCRLHSSSAYLNQIQKGFEPKQVEALKKVVYVPRKTHETTRHFNALDYPPTWYFEWQKAMADLFSGYKDIQFVFKCPSSQEYQDNSIIPYVKEKGYSNITFERTSLLDCLEEADAVVLDYPTSAVFESAAREIPIISLFHKMLPLWDETVSMFGKTITQFNEIEEAISSLKQFIEGGYKEEAVVRLQSENDVMASVKKLCVDVEVTDRKEAPKQARQSQVLEDATK